MSIASKSGRDVIATQSSRPRKLESPMCAANAANTRPEMPLSPSSPRLPNTASASSTTTITGPSARIVINTRDCWRSVSPTHFERNSPISITGKPHSLAKQSMRNDFPTPTRPGTRIPRSSTSVLAFLMSQARSRNFFFAAVCVATRSRFIPGLIFESHESLAVFFNQALLAVGQNLLRHTHAIANSFGEKMLDAQQIQTGSARSEVLYFKIAPLGNRFTTRQRFGPAGLQIAQALVSIRQIN